MKWEIKVKKEKTVELQYYDSALFKLLRKTASNLRRTKAGKRQKRKPQWGVCPSRGICWIENAPKTALKRLQRKFAEYVDRPVNRKPHQHLWRLESEDHGVLWLTCADWQCDAEAQLLLTDNFGILQSIILPYYRATKRGKTIYKTREEKQRIAVFLENYKEEMMREGMKELEKRLAVYEKLQGSLGTIHELRIKRNILRLKKDKKDCQMAALVL